VRSFSFVVTLCLLVAALVWGYHERGKSSILAASLAAAEARATKAEAASTSCTSGSMSSFSRAISQAMAAKSAAPKPGIVAHAEEPHDGKKLSFDDMSGDDQAEMFNAVDEAKANGKKKLDELTSRLKLTSDQEQAMHQDVDKMNARIGESLESLVRVLSQAQKGNMPSRPVIDALADGLNAVRESEDAFRTTLDESQQSALSNGGLEFVQQIDPTLVMSAALGLASSIPKDGGVMVSASK
jgi:hypothetical protein